MPGTPTAWFDGTLWDEGAWDNDQQMYDWYLSDYTTCRAAPTDVTVSVTGVQQAGQTFTIRARVCVEAGGVAKTVRIYMAQVLDHWPTTFTYLRNGFKQAATTEDVILAAGECQLVTRTFTFDATSWANQRNIRLIVWAQEPQADSTHANPATTYQAAVLNWPFAPDCNANGVPDAEDISSGLSADCNTNGVPDECDIATGTAPDCNSNGIPDSCDLASGTSQDCNTNSVPDECDIASGTAQDANANGIPDECEILRGDLNCDGTVNFTDINSFVLMLSDPAAWQLEYPACLLANGDLNDDGSANFRDINPFIVRLTTP
jgi:hypothetical protein